MLIIPVTLVMTVLMMILVPFQKMGTTPNPMDVHRMMGRFSLVWVVLMALNIVVQTFAMRWMLKTRWADFRLTAVGREDV